MVKEDSNKRGVVYFSRVPHGFYEKEMKHFLSQFGKVTNINIPRSSRTGKYKGFAFVEFLYTDVAKIVAETMNNYLMYKKVLKAKYIPPEEQKSWCFKLKKARTPLLMQRRKCLRDKSNQKLNKIEQQKETTSLQKLISKKQKKLKRLGVSYDIQIRQTNT